MFLYIFWTECGARRNEVAAGHGGSGNLVAVDPAAIATVTEDMDGTVSTHDEAVSTVMKERRSRGGGHGGVQATVHQRQAPASLKGLQLCASAERSLMGLQFISRTTSSLEVAKVCRPHHAILQQHCPICASVVAHASASLVQICLTSLLLLLPPPSPLTEACTWACSVMIEVAAS